MSKKKHPSKDAEDPKQELKESQDLLLPESYQEKAEAQDRSLDQELADDQVFKTQDSDGHTLNPFVAEDQGLTYTPPTDPPTLASEDPQGAEIAAGFATSMEQTDPDVRDLPPSVDNNDLDLQDDVYLALRNNSETGHLTTVKVQVDEGVVNLIGTVESEDDIARVQTIVAGLEGVREIRNNLLVDLR